jgi:Ca-activated chloride channel family protein
MAVKQRMNSVAAAAAVSLVLAAGALFYCLVLSNACAINTFLFTADQQGQRLYRQGQYAAAAERFASPKRRAAAYFRDGDFKKAAALYSGMGGAEGQFNHGNALVMLGKYEDAVNAYDRVLAQKPDWQDPAINRRIARDRAERVKKEGGDMTGGELGADDFTFEKSKGKSQSKEAAEPAGEAEMQAMWLRRVQTKPADFLRAKFAYQQVMKSGQ